MSTGQGLLIHPFATDKTGVHDQKPARPWLSVVWITVLALAIRLVWLGSKSLWVDEADSFYFASHTFPEIFSRLCDPHPPGYYALLRLSLALGHSEFWVRLPSAVAGALAVPMLYALGLLAASVPQASQLDAAFSVRGLDQRTGVLASLLLAVAPLHVWYSQEARMYALVTTLGLCAVYFALRFALCRHAGDALGYVLVASAALFVDQSSGLPLLLANLLWGGLWLRRRREWAGRGWWELAMWAGLQLIIGITFWLWWSQALFPSLLGVGTTYQPGMVMLVLQRLGLPITLSSVRWMFAIGPVILTAAGIWLYVSLIRRHWMSRLLPYVAPAVVALFVLVTIGSTIPRAFTVKRLLVSLLPYGLLISAWAMQRLQFSRWLWSATVAFSLVLSAVSIWLIPKEPWREVVAAVQEKTDPSDVLWVDELAVPAFDYYYSGLPKRLILRTARLHELKDESDARARGGRIWVVTRVDPYRNLFDYFPSSFARELVWSGDWHRVSVRAYAPDSADLASSAWDISPPPWLLEWPSPVDDACQK
jgi:hypothetical protein